MQLSHQKGHIVEKILQTPQGAVRATFLVYQSHGRIRARLISAQLIEKAKTLVTKILALPAVYAKNTVLPVVESVFASIAVPQLSEVILISQPPRAPNFSF